jgi:ribose-phosphate pyrophosphokinase
MRVKIILALLLITTPLWVFAEDTLVVGIRGNKSATEAYVAAKPGRAIAEEEKTFEFESGGTSARIKSSIPNKSVVILLPQFLNANTLMEALIKTRIARQNGAHTITIESPVALSTIPVLDSRGEQIQVPVDSMLAVAGAQFVHEANGKTRGLTSESMWLFPRLDATKSFIFGDDHPQLRDDLAKEMNIPILDRSKDLPAAQIFYLAPFISPANEIFFKQMADIRALVAAGARVEAIYPYQPYARLDQMGGTGGTVPGRLVADIIESVGTSSITFVRPHAIQSVGFYKIPTYHLSGMETMVPVLKSRKVTVIVSPDNGAMKESTLYAEALDAALAVINKQRVGEKIKIVGMTAAFRNGKRVSIKGKVVASPDDETDTGSTGGKGGERVAKKKPKKFIFNAMHLRGAAKAAIESPHVNEAIFSDTLPIPAGIRANKKVTVVSIAPELGRSLNRIRVDCPSVIFQLKSDAK